MPEKTSCQKPEKQDQVREKAPHAPGVPGNMLEMMGETVIPTLAINKDHVVTHWNLACEKLTGFTLKEMIGEKEAWKAFYEQKRPLLADLIVDGASETVIGGYYPGKYKKSDVVEGAYEVRDFFPRLGKQGKWLFFTATPFRDASGNITGAIETFLDITHQITAEKALRDSEAKMRSIFRAAPVGIGLVSNRRLLEVNERLCEMTGYSRDELVGKNARILYPTDADYAYVGSEKYRQIREHGTGTVETRFRCKDNRVIDILMSSTPIDLADWSAGVTFTALDITSRKQAEKRLKESQERFLTVLDSIDATIYVADMETWEILFMNQYMIKSFGRDMTGEICWKSFRKESGPCSHCTNERLVDETGNPTGVAVWNDRNPVTGRWYINYDRAIKWTDGRLVKLQIATDITDLKNMEKELRQAQRMESVGYLAGGIAHDFNNILFPIVGLSEMLMEDFPEGSIEYQNAKEILTAGKRGSELVKQILAFSRQSEDKRIPVQFQSVLKEALKLCRSTIPVNIEIHQEIQNNCGFIMANPTQLHQIAMNLITNAYHAVETDHGDISVSLSETELEQEAVPTSSLEPGRYVMLTVSDKGSGIDPAAMDKIFDPYFTTKEKGKGTGLGLSVVHGIVKEYGGDIKVYSAPGEGTTVTVYIPLMESPVENIPDKKPGVALTGHERILLVDDEEQIVQMEKIMLERLGYKVTYYTGSVDALEAFKAKPDAFDLVITDMSMPNMTGDRLAKELIAIKPDMPVIILTGFSERINREKAKAMGIKGFLMKPVVRSDMAQEVRSVLDEA